MILFVFCVSYFFVSTNAQFPLTFTGDAEKDFIERGPGHADFATQRYPVVVIPDAADAIGNVFLDVGTPPGWPYPQSGWDFKDLRFAYDYARDEFHMAINCFGICGDADGDGDPSRTAAELTARGGQVSCRLSVAAGFATSCSHTHQ